MTDATTGDVPREGTETTTKIPVQESRAAEAKVPKEEHTHKNSSATENQQEEKSRRPPLVPAGYWHAFEGKAGVLNVFAALGVIFALPFFPLGLLFSFIGLSNAQKHRFDRPGKVLAIVGIGLSLAAALFALVHLFVKISVGMLY